MNRIALLAAASFLTATTAACVPASRFEWGNYENALYAYYKNPVARENYREALTRAIERGEENGNVAPGMYAELGFLQLEDGDDAGAFALFEKEMTLFPESRPFLERIIANMSGGEPAAAIQPVSDDGARP